MPDDYRVRRRDAGRRRRARAAPHRACSPTWACRSTPPRSTRRSAPGWPRRCRPAPTARGWPRRPPATSSRGGGITIIPWPPGPQYAGDRLAFVYNVYTEPAHRRRGLARRIMEAIHHWCRDAGITSMALNASRDGQPLYESMGYVESPSPMMFLPIVGYNSSAQSLTQADQSTVPQRRRSEHAIHHHRPLY